MKTSGTNPKVDGFLKNAERWREEMASLRGILLDCGLTEELKWGKPCYAFQENNVLIIQPFKEQCAVMFFKGALLKDTHGVLIKPGEHSQAGRQIRFTNVREIAENETILRAYIQQAIEIEKAGLEVTFKRNPEPVPDELQNKFAKNTAFKTAFNAITPGRQRAYILYFSAAKQSKTRESRIEKWMPRILKGKGLNDQ
jgi:uncharacterized protein YdeI (YjbR/CyaY-like superfamily)